MDELLSLFNADDDGGDNDTSHQETQATQTSKTKYHSSEGAPSFSTTNNDDFGSSFASAFATQSNNTKKNINEENVLNKSRVVVKQHQSYTTKSTTTIHKHKSTTSCSDPYTNFVITDRRTSRANMVNAFSTLTYKSCSVLAASSRAEWNTFLVDGGGSGSIGNGGASGKTKLATCGILTQDVSSQLSSKTGRAFAKLLLGDLPSSSSSSSSSSSNNMHSTISIARGSNNNINPSITVFLFGDAINILKSNMKYMKAGYAIAILNPNLMPTNNNGGNGTTSVTLSINNPNQLLPIGKASDCNKCMGTMRIRTQSDYVGMKWEDVRCTTLVDCRFGGGYCDKHKRQGLGHGGGKSNSSNKGNSNSMTFMQKQRSTQQQSMSQMRGNNNNNRGVIWVGQRGGHTNASSFNNIGHQGGGRLTSSSSLSEALSQSGLLGQQSTQSISSLGSKQQLLKRAPLHMKKSQPISSTTVASNKLLAPVSSTSSSSTTKNPYSNKSSQKASQSKSSNPRKRKEVDDILGKALGRTIPSDESNHRPGKKMNNKKKKTSLLSSSTTKRPVKVFTTEGYDGTVHVPKPNKLLFQHGASLSVASSSMVTPSPDNNRISSALILDKQRNLAELLKRKQDITTPAANMKRGLSINNATLARSKQKIVSTTVEVSR